MKGRYVLILSLLGGFAMLAVSLYQQHRYAAEMRDLRRQVTALSTTVESSSGPPGWSGEMQRPVIVFSNAPPGMPAASPAPGHGSEQPAPSATQKPRDMPPSEVNALYDGAFASDRADPGWTARDQRETVEKIHALLPEGSELRSLDCRESLCRIETRHPDMARHVTFYQRALVDPATQLWNGPMYTAPVEDDPSWDGPIVAVAYLARPGKELPPVAEP
jgi:hypothetical protein